MSLSRPDRRTAICAALVTGLLAASGTAMAQAYPDKPIRVIIPFTPGGGTDNLSRLVGTRVGEKNGWTMVMDNKAGAAGTIGIGEAVKAAPTGYEIVMGQADNLAVGPLLSKSVTYNPVKDLKPIAHVADQPIILLTSASSPHKTLADVVKASKAKPGSITYASAGAGTVSHLVVELFNGTAGITLRHVPYKGSAPAMADMLGGHVDLMSSSVSSAIAQIKAGKARGLAVSTAKRSSILPDVPTIAEAGFAGFDVATWYGFFAPSGVPDSIITTLNKAVNATLPELREAINNQGGELRIISPEALGQLLASDIEKWRGVIKAANIKLE